MPVYVEMVTDKKNGKKIEKKVNGQKQYYIRTYVNDENGCRKQITRHNKEWLGRDGYWEAQQEENRLKNKKYNNYENITLNELFDMYLKHIENSLKLSSIKKYKGNYLYIRPILGSEKVFLLENKDILYFHNYLDKTNKNSNKNANKLNLSLVYKRSIHVTLVSILNFGCKYIGLKKNVASIVGNFKMPNGNIKKEMNFLEKEEFDRFIQYEKNTIYKDFFTLLFYTGMRRGELLALTIGDVNFKTKEIKINKSINPKNGGKSTSPKTSKSNRTIKMLTIVEDTLKKYKNNDNDKEIFGLSKIAPTTLARKCDNNCKHASINKKIRIHDFRHSFASLCINNNIPIEIISEYLGHENISTTLDIYSHLYPNSQEKLVTILNSKL